MWASCILTAFGLAVVDAVQLTNPHGTRALREEKQHVNATTWAHANKRKAIKRKDQPHIIYILADDLGWSGVGYHNDKVKTPAIDDLAKDGVKLESFYTYTYCAPSRFALLTGRDAWKSEAGGGNFKIDLPIGTSTQYTMLPKALKAAGYQTHMVGKWHQGFHMKEYTPSERGFDTFYGLLSESSDHNTNLIENTKRAGCKYKGSEMFDLSEDGAPVVSARDSPQFGDDRYRERAVQLIEDNANGNPMFLYLCLQMPHSPFQVPAEYAALYKEKNQEVNEYLGMISHVDKSVSDVVDALKKNDMWDKTIFIFSSDNGASAERFDEPFNANYPLKGHKGQLHEGGVRVPAFVSGGFLPDSARGRTLDGLMSLTDWYATLADISGHEVDNAGPFRSNSISNWKYIAGESEASARDELILLYAPDANLQTAMWQGKWKYLQDPVQVQLFDLSTDPETKHDVSKENKELFKEMQERIEQEKEISSQMAWFNIHVPDEREIFTNKACAAWTTADGFLGPWASVEDERALHLTRK